MTEYLKQNVWKTDDGILKTECLENMSGKQMTEYLKQNVWKTDDGILKTECLENR